MPGPTPPFGGLTGLPYSWLQSGSFTGMIPYVISSRLYHTYRAIVRRDSSLLFGAERALEIHWVYKQLWALSPGLLLEVGDVLGPTLTRTRFTVETADLRPRRSTSTPSWRPLVRDVRFLGISNKYDVAVSISTLEHIGMGHYGDEIDPNGDAKCVAAVERALKPGGKFLVTLPMSRGQDATWQRLYTVDRIIDLFRRFKIWDIQVYHYRWVAWRRATDASSISPRTFGPVDPEVTCIACLVAEKTESGAGGSVTAPRS